MTALERMTKERDRLLAEANELTKAIELIEKFKEKGAIATPREIPLRKKRGGEGLRRALHQCAEEAISIYDRPVSREEVLSFLPAKGFTREQAIERGVMKCLGDRFKAEGTGAGSNGKIWYRDRLRPIMDEWKQELSKVK